MVERAMDEQLMIVPIGVILEIKNTIPKARKLRKGTM